jgi:hypothetical protein
MSDFRDLRVERAAPARSADPVQAAPFEQPATSDAALQKSVGRHAGVKHDEDVVAALTGRLRNAYAQYIFDPETNDVVVRIRDAATDQVLSELPSPEVQAMTQHLREYAAMLARRRIALQSSAQA